MAAGRVPAGRGRLVTGTDPGVLLVDGHVHFHDCFDPTAFCAAAADHARRQAPGVPGSVGVLLLTESAGADAFSGLREGRIRPEGWQVEPSEEPFSLWLRSDSAKLLICAGRQVVTRENLEVLALITGSKLPDGHTIEETLDAAAEAGAFRVVPWGFGKWTAARGRRVAGLLERYAAPDFALGDNGGRLRHGRRPTLFSLAEQRGVRVLPGSDPLPFPHHQTRPGSYGVRIAAGLDTGRPGRDLLSLLTDPGTEWVPFGRREGLFPFLRNQVAMQIRKRFGEAA